MSIGNPVLVFPDFAESRYGATHAPTGLGYISEALTAGGVEHSVLDLRLEKRRNYERLFRALKPRMVGISLMTRCYRNHYALIREIRRWCGPTTTIVVGGPHVSTLREEVLTECSEIDLGVVGDGEIAMVELCRGEEPAAVAGVLYRDGDAVRYSGNRPFDRHIDAFAFPRHDRFQLTRYVSDEMPIVTSRGCPYACTFCSVAAANGRIFRVRSPKNVCDEIEYWYEKGRRHIAVVDDCFTLNAERVFAICDEVESRRLTGLHFRSPNGVRADRCSFEMLKRMKSIGWEYIAFGVESANEEVRRRLRKNLPLERVAQAVSDACALGLDVVLFFLVGSPGEDWNALEESVKFAQRWPLYDAKFFNLIPFPKTELFTTIETEGRFVRRPEDYLDGASAWDDIPVFETAEMDTETKQRALAYTRSIREHVRRKAISRSFARLGPLGDLLAYAYMTETAQWALMHSRFVRRLGLAVYDSRVRWRSRK